MNRVGEISDLIMEISSRLPAKSVARFRCVSKLWGSMFHRPYFTELFLKRSYPRLLFALERGREWSFFSSPQLQNPYGKSSSSLALSADLHIKFSKYVSPVDFGGLTSGLIYFYAMRISKRKDGEAVPVIFNPRTRHYATLPKPITEERSESFLGFDPIDKKFKVLSLTCSRYCGNDEVFGDLLTLGTGKMSWRKIKCPVTHYPIRRLEGICINGVLYYLAHKVVKKSHEIDERFVLVCFDVGSETYKFVEAEEEEEGFYYKDKLINYKGKLGRTNLKRDGDGKTLELCVWVLEDVEKQEWSKDVYILPANELLDLRYVYYEEINVSVVGVTATGEIVLSNAYASKPFYIFYFNPKGNTLQHVEIRGFGEYYSETCQWNHHRVYAYVDYVEDLNVADAKYLKSSQGLHIYRRRPTLPKPQEICNSAPSFKKKQPTIHTLNKYDLLANLE